jgi:hypothetical protein
MRSDEKYDPNKRYLTRPRFIQQSRSEETSTRRDVSETANLFRIGTGEREKLKDTGVPGPGAYHIPVKLAWTPQFELPAK